MLFFCTCTLYLRNQAHVQRTYKQIFLQNQVRTPAYTHKKSYVTSADMNKSVTLAQTHTHTHAVLSRRIHAHTHSPTHTQQTDTDSDTHTHTITGRRSHTHAEREQSCLLCFASSSTEEWHFEGLGGVGLRAGGSVMKNMSQDGGRGKPTKSQMERSVRGEESAEKRSVQSIANRQ